MRPTLWAGRFDRSVVITLRLLWWLGGGVALLLWVSDVESAEIVGRPLPMVVGGFVSIVGYALLSRRPEAGVLLASASGLFLALFGSSNVPNPQGVTWWVLVVGCGVATWCLELRRLAVVLSAAIGTVVVTGIAWFKPDVRSFAFGSIGLLLGASVAIGAWRRLVARRNALALIRVRDSERAEIARELHDVVAHHITAIVVQAQAAQVTSDPDLMRRSLGAVEAEGAAAMAAMRRMVATLRGADPPTTSTDLVVELDDLGAVLRGAGLNVQHDVGDVPSELAPTIVRLTREAYTNVRRHAPEATTVQLSVNVDSAVVHWAVVDDGGPSHRSGDGRHEVRSGGGGFGLVGLQERVDALGGRFFAGAVGDGWEVRAELPVGATT